MSIPIKENTKKHYKKTIIQNSDDILTYTDYFNKNIELKKYKLPELKLITKFYKLHITGNKNILIYRIEELFKKMKFATKIQNVFRGWLVRISFKLRGMAFKTRSICVNDTDYVTLEPLVEIPFQQFYSYKDENDFIYGFNISSLAQELKNKKHLLNPYNREPLKYNDLRNIIFLNNITQLIFPEYKDDSIKLTMNVNVNTSRPAASRELRNIMSLPSSSSLHNILSQSYFQPNISRITNIDTQLLRDKLQVITDIRLKSVHTRIQELFMEIDQLGNYTDCSWFINLDRREYVRLYRCLYDIWLYRGQLTHEIKVKISPLFDPFVNIFTHNIHHLEITLDQIQFLCLTVMENIVYMGIDIEYRKIGTLHALSALTVVSQSARSAMPWLYESLAY